MNVFVLNTGRCGSVTFIKACQHITNYSCAHESRCAMLGQDRLGYPENHIEADNRLSWLLGRLDRTYGNEAFYVHLKRNDIDTARSFTRRYSSGIISAYRGAGILLGLPEDSPPMAVALDYCDTVNRNIELFLKDKSQTMTINLEDIDQDFAAFWAAIGAEGDRGAALQEFAINHNASPDPVDTAKGSAISRPLRKLGRLIARMSDFVRRA